MMYPHSSKLFDEDWLFCVVITTKWATGNNEQTENTKQTEIKILPAGTSKVGANSITS